MENIKLLQWLNDVKLTEYFKEQYKKDGEKVNRDGKKKNI